MLYGNRVNFSVSSAALTATIIGANWVGPVAAPAVTGYLIDWGDGQQTSGAGGLIAVADRSHVYAVGGAVTVTITVTADRVDYSASQSVLVQ